MEKNSMGNETKVKYPCQTCSASFTKEGFLRNHIRKRHPEQTTEPDKKCDEVEELLGRGKRRKHSTGFDESSKKSVLETTKDEFDKNSDTETQKSQLSIPKRRSAVRPKKRSVKYSDAVEKIKPYEAFSSSESATQSHSSIIASDDYHNNEASNNSVENLLNSFIQNSVTPLVKRSRGRPKKQKDSLSDNLDNSKDSESVETVDILSSKKLNGKMKWLNTSEKSTRPEQSKHSLSKINNMCNNRQCDVDNKAKKSKRKSKDLGLLNEESTEQILDHLQQNEDSVNNIQSDEEKIEISSKAASSRRSRSSRVPLYRESDNDSFEESGTEVKDEEVKPRKRGRPKGSSNGTTKMVVNEVLAKPVQSELKLSDEEYNSKSKPRRKRGRKQLVMLEFSEFADDIISKKRGRPSKAMLEQLVKNMESLEPNKIEKVTCTCLLEFPSWKEFTNHNLRYHNGLFRKLGDERPFSAYEKNIVLKKAIKSLKKLKCLNELCSKSFTSVGGYLKHEIVCGKDKEQRMVTCELCGKDLIESSMYAHKKLIHDKVKIITELEEIDPSQKRMAAKKAAEKLALIPKDLKVDKRDALDEDFEFQSEEENEDELEIVEDKIEKVGRKTSVPIPHDEDVLKEMWKKDINFKGLVHCRNEGCNRKEEDIEKIIDHFVKCSYRQYDVYECKFCEFRKEKKALVADHITCEHNELISDDNSADIEVFIKKFYCQAKPSTYKMDKRKRRADQQINTLVRNTFFQYLSLAKNYVKNNFCNGIGFPDWLPFASHWIKVPKKKMKLFLPKIKCSSEFKCQMSYTVSKEDCDWKKLKLFESTELNNDQKFKMCFVGGPVKACAWCPTSLQTSCSQYLALYCHNDPDVKLTNKDISNNPCLIQIWNVGELELKDNSPGKLVLAIADTCGAIWDLTWCPSGCWNIGEDSNKNINSEIMPRIGLLSAACADGFVKVYSIPCPSSLKSDCGIPMYEVKPTAVLVLNPNIEKYSRVQCTTLSWFQGKGHDFIAGGYANGLIAVWHLTSKSPLIMIEKENGDRFIVSHLCFRGHGNIVTGIDFSHRYSGKYLVSCSRDRSVKFWNLENISLPLNVIKNRSVSTVKWHPFWCGAFLGSDNCYSLNYNGMLFVDLDFFGELGGSAINHHGSVNDLSTSLWMKCIATCDEAGEVILSVFSDIEKINLASNYKMLPLFCVSLKEKEKPECNPDEEKTSEDINTLLKSVSKQFLYEDTAKRFKIVYTDQSMNKPLPMSRPFMNCYPLHSVNKIVWNPNLGSHCWLASGDQFGMLRLYNVSQIDHVTVDKVRHELKT